MEGVGDMQRAQVPRSLLTEGYVLVVDDDRHTLRSIDEFFRAWRWRTRAAEDVASALAIVKRSLPDAAVLDLVLPDGSGLEIARPRSRPSTKSAVRGSAGWLKKSSVAAVSTKRPFNNSAVRLATRRA